MYFPKLSLHSASLLSIILFPFALAESTLLYFNLSPNPRYLSWQSAFDLAAENNFLLPTQEELKQSGVRPYRGAGQDEWHPVRRSDGIVNDWVNIGTWYGISDYISHLDYDDIGFTPAWGLTDTYAHFRQDLVLYVTFPACDDDEMKVNVDVETDFYSSETSWEITDVSTGEKLAGVEPDDYSNFVLYGHQYCFPPDECLQFEMKDSYGDGIDSYYGGYNLTVDDVLLATSLDDMFGDFDYSESVTFGNGCESGSPSASPSEDPTTLPSAGPSTSPSVSPSITPTDVTPCPEEDRNAKFWTGELKEKDNGGVKARTKKCKWLANAGTWKINKYCSMTEGYQWTKPAREVCTEVCKSC